MKECAIELSFKIAIDNRKYQNFDDNMKETYGSLSGKLYGSCLSDHIFEI